MTAILRLGCFAFLLTQPPHRFRGAFTMTAQRPGPMPAIPNISFPPHLDRFNLPAHEYILRHKKPWDGIAVGALVFSSPESPEPSRVLLIQRAKTDSLPDKWEIPSGVVSNDASKDITVISAVARELWEETGLLARGLVRLVTVPPGGQEGQTEEDGFVFSNSTRTKVFCRYVFEVDVGTGEQQDIKLNPCEHQDWKYGIELLKLGMRRRRGRRLSSRVSTCGG